MNEIQDYSNYHESLSGGEIQLLSKLMEELEHAKMEQAEASEILKGKTKRVTELEQHDIPELMLSMNTKKHETASGLVVSLQETVRCSIPVANRPKCMTWLIQHGHSALIKDTVSVSFKVEEHDEALALKERLVGDHHQVTQDQKVEPSSMRAFIKRQLEQGVDFPMEMFGAFQQQKAVIKIKKKAENF